MNIEVSNRLEELRDDLHQIEEAKKAVKDVFLRTFSENLEYAGITMEDAETYLDDMLSDAYATANLEQEIEELEQSEAQSDLDDLRREYYASQL